MEYTKHAWAGAWVNSLFRNEGAGLSSVLILEAVALTRGHWPDVPPLGMVTFIDPSAVLGPVYGSCYRAAGFKRERCCCPPSRLEGPWEEDGLPPRCDGSLCDGVTASNGLMAFRMKPAAMPQPIVMQGSLF